MPRVKQTPYGRDQAKALDEWRLRYMVRAVVLAGGSLSLAAKRIGVHKNTVWGTLNKGGYGHARIMAMVRAELDKHADPQGHARAKNALR